MTRQVLFAQGAGEGTHGEWDAKLVESLRASLGKAFSVLYPRMPNEGNPQPCAWKVALRQEFLGLHDGDVLVGHSFGGAMLLHTMAEESLPFTAGALVLLAIPFYGEGGWDSQDLQLPPHPARHLPRDLPIRLYHGTKDDTVPFAHLDLYRKAIPQAAITALPNGEHQFNDDLADVARDILRLIEDGTRRYS